MKCIKHSTIVFEKVNIKGNLWKIGNSFGKSNLLTKSDRKNNLNIICKQNFFCRVVNEKVLCLDNNILKIYNNEPV